MSSPTDHDAANELGTAKPIAETNGRNPATAGRLVIHQPGAAELSPRRHYRRERAISLALGIGTPLLLIVLWQVASSREWISSTIYPSPSEIGSRAQDLWKEGRLQDDLSISTQRLLLGYAYGALGGIAIGLVTSMFRRVRQALEPMLNALYTVPKLALISVFLLIFGFGEGAVIALIAVTVFFFVWIPTLAAIVSLPHGYREAARSLGVNRRRLFTDVLLPAALPQIFVGLRVAAGVAVLMLIGVEFVMGSDGIGYLIDQGRQLNIAEQSYVGMVVSALMGVVFMAIIKFIGRLLTRWADDQSGDALI